MGKMKRETKKKKEEERTPLPPRKEGKISRKCKSLLCMPMGENEEEKHGGMLEVNKVSRFKNFAPHTFKD